MAAWLVDAAGLLAAWLAAGCDEALDACVTERGFEIARLAGEIDVCSACVLQDLVLALFQAPSSCLRRT